MAESFESFDSILRDCAKDTVEKRFVEAVSRCEKQEEEIKRRFFFCKMTRKKYSSSLERD